MAGPVVLERTSGWGIVNALFDAGPPRVTPRDLLRDCAEERSLAACLKAHAMGITYPSLKATMERVAQETAGHAEALADLLTSDGLAAPRAAESVEPTAYPSMVRDVQGDALTVRERVARYEDLLRKAPRSLRLVLEPIYEDKREHARLLVEVAIRICR